ncbi:class I SAM-dependent methyltransferase [Halobacteriovorax sp. HLS]|uniref:class I SAM-dependent methyltransferase n=1 Tax=Halobacteriovorax sp. HLS TaxID=2234000 RepID=UPI000FDA75AC|nr:class I SAM-dependent methyltransferase [Halobacteriovorax sp. HLS]
MNSIITKIYQSVYPIWKTKFAKPIKQRRMQYIIKHSNGVLDSNEPKRILDMGCNNGMDFLIHFEHKKNFDLHGVDIEDYSYEGRNVTFHKTDGVTLPFEDNYFDLTVSIGVLEHVQPIENLCSVISEINRVSKNYVVVVPSIGTILEPHAVRLFWGIRSAQKKISHEYLNYFSDEAWMQFKGFMGAKSKRFWYIPCLIKNFIIWK